MDVDYHRVSLNDDGGDDSDDDQSYEDDDELIPKPNERACRMVKCTRKCKIMLCVLVAITGEYVVKDKAAYIVLISLLLDWP